MGRYWKVASVLVMIGALSACKTMEDFADACSSYGFGRGTQAFANCVQQEKLANDARRQSAVQSLQAMQAQQEQQRISQQQMFLNQNQRMRANCTTNYMGSTAYTNCW